MDSKLAGNRRALSCTDCFKLRRLSSAYSQCGLLEVSQFHANTIKAVQRLHLLQVRAVDESSRRARSSKSESTRRSRSVSGGQSKQYLSSIAVGARPPAQSSPELIWPLLGTGVFVAVIYALVKWMGANKETSNAKLSSFSSGAESMLGGSERKFRRDSMARLNEFAKELRTFGNVDMSGRNFGDEGFIFLAESLAFNKNAEAVDFSANGITEVGLKALADVLPTNTYTRNLNLSGNSFGDEGSKDLAAMLENNHGVQKLQLNSTNIGDEGAKALAEMLKKNSAISTIELNNNSIEYSGFAALAEALTTNNTLSMSSLNARPTVGLQQHSRVVCLLSKPASTTRPWIGSFSIQSLGLVAKKQRLHSLATALCVPLGKQLPHVDKDNLFAEIIKSIFRDLQDGVLFIFKQPKELRYLEFPSLQSAGKMAIFTIAVVMVLIVFLATVDSGLSFIVASVFRRIR